MTIFYFSHVQTVLKITSSAVQTRFSRLDQSQAGFSWNVPQLRLQPIGAEHPPRNLIEWVSIIIFGLHPKEKCLKLGEVVQLCRQWFWPSARNQLFQPSVGWNFKKFFLISSCLGTCLVNDYKTNFFPHAHSGLHRPGKQKTAISGQIRSKATMPRHGSRVVEFFFSLPLGTSGQVGLLKLPIKWPYHNFIN